MLSPLCAQRIEHYRQSMAVMDDVQILYEGVFDPKVVGHYICVHSVYPEQKVYIYDSLNYDTISGRAKSILRLRYPQHTGIVFVRAATCQPDLRACGVFAAAYATTIILGQDPATYPLQLGTRRNPTNRDQTTDLRYHLTDIIANSRLSLFPSF